jgi:hypothetical protein
MHEKEPTDGDPDGTGFHVPDLKDDYEHPILPQENASIPHELADKSPQPSTGRSRVRSVAIPAEPTTGRTLAGLMLGGAIATAAVIGWLMWIPSDQPATPSPPVMTDMARLVQMEKTLAQNRTLLIEGLDNLESRAADAAESYKKCAEASKARDQWRSNLRTVVIKKGQVSFAIKQIDERIENTKAIKFKLETEHGVAGFQLPEDDNIDYEVLLQKAHTSKQERDIEELLGIPDQAAVNLEIERLLNSPQ